MDCDAAPVYEIDPLCDARWATLIQTHPESSVFHSPNWLAALRHVYGYEPAVVTTCSPGNGLANGLVFCRIKSWLTGRRLVSLPFSDHCEPLIDSQDELDVMLLEMKRQVEAGEWKYVEIRPISMRAKPAHRTEATLIHTIFTASICARARRSYFETFTKTAFKERFDAPNGKSCSTKRERRRISFRSSIVLL